MIETPYNSAVAVTPHDTNDQGLTNGCSALVIGTAGALAVKMHNGANVTFGSVPAGILQISVTRVFATGTAASNITALWR